MRDNQGIAAVLMAIIMIFIQFGGTKSVHYLYDARPETPKKIELPPGWPPTLDEKYPDLDLFDKDGRHLKLSDFKGKVIFVIPINMNNPVVQRLEGADLFGSYNDGPYDRGIKSIYENITLYAPELKLPDSNLIFVHVIFHDYDQQIPAVQDAALWAKHFKLDKSQNHIVAISAQKIPDYATNAIIKRIHLIDKDFILRAEAEFPEQKKSYMKNVLVPMLPILLK